MHVNIDISIDIDMSTVQRSYQHDIYVLEEKFDNKILLGIDFMKKLSKIAFDFTNNRIKLGEKWLSGASLKNEKGLRLTSKLFIPRHSECIFNVMCDRSLAFILFNFEPRAVPGVKEIYLSRTRTTNWGKLI